MPCPATLQCPNNGGGGTRTCIHTPSAPLQPAELQSRIPEILKNAALVYFDGRLTDAAIPVAKAARSLGQTDGSPLSMGQV